MAVLAWFDGLAALAATTTRQQYGSNEAADNDIVRWRHIHSDM
jgi:hypothetical protein